MALELQCKKLKIHFGGIAALDDVSFTAVPGKVTGIIGPNGAGKTTLLNCITRFYNPTDGQIQFGDVDLLKLQPHDLIRVGVTRTFQYTALFENMTVRDNLLAAMHASLTHGLLGYAFPRKSVWLEEKKAKMRADEVMEMLNLKEFKTWPAMILPYGIRKKVDLGRALMMHPKLVILDEPASGLSKEEILDFTRLVVRIRDEIKAGVILVEHNVPLVMELSDSIIVLDFGKKIAEGTPVEIQQNQDVIRSYLGTA